MRRQRGLRGVVTAVAVLTLACTQGSSEAPDSSAKGAAEVAPSVDFGATWILSVARDPAPIQALLSSNPQQGWQLLYQRQYEAAAESFAAGTAPSDAIGQARAQLAIAELFSSAHQLALDVLDRMEVRLKENADRIAAAPSAGYFAASRALQAGDAAGALSAVDGFLAQHPAHPLKDVAVALRGGALYAKGDKAQAEAAWKKVATPDGKAVAAAWMARFGHEGVTLPASSDDLSMLGKRALLAARVESGDLDGAMALSQTLDGKAPDFSETVGEGESQAERKEYDPMVLESTARLHARLALKAVGAQSGPASWIAARARAVVGEPLGVEPSAVAAAPVTAAELPALAFGDLATPADLARDLARLKGETLEKGLESEFLKALGPVTAAPDQGRQVREAQDLGRSWEEALQAQLKALPEGDGPSMAQGLQLPRGLVASLLQARARQLIQAGKALEGLALLEYTFEKEKSSSITWINEPQLFLDTTAAYCQLDRYREALNYLYRLLDSYPQLWSFYEVLGNLSVLDTLDRLGIDGGP